MVTQGPAEGQSGWWCFSLRTQPSGFAVADNELSSRFEIE